MLIHVATITGAHGIKGEVKIKSLTALPAAFAGYGPFTTAEGRVHELLRAKQAKDDFICTLRNVTDRNRAEALRGVELCVNRAKLPSLAEGEFYLQDLTGKPVEAEGKTVGTVAGFQNYGAGDLMELQDGLLLPVRFVTEVDEAVKVALPEGYLNEAEQP